jgi:hypothetical protein
MDAVRIYRYRIHTVIQALQDQGPGGEGPAKISRAKTGSDRARNGSDPEVDSAAKTFVFASGALLTYESFWVDCPFRSAKRAGSFSSPFCSRSEPETAFSSNAKRPQPSARSATEFSPTRQGWVIHKEVQAPEARHLGQLHRESCRTSRPACPFPFEVDVSLK